MSGNQVRRSRYMVRSQQFPLSRPPDVAHCPLDFAQAGDDLAALVVEWAIDSQLLTPIGGVSGYRLFNVTEPDVVLAAAQVLAQLVASVVVAVLAGLAHGLLPRSV